MSEIPDNNALLLQVMAHDLLAPLTATKWQLELLGRKKLDASKREAYIESIQESTELGIRLTKHAHVAGRILVGSYEPDLATLSLSSIVYEAANVLHLQFERHGVELDVQIEGETEPAPTDKELVSLFIWSLAKFFLSCAPAHASVSMRGTSTPKSEISSYVLTCTASEVPQGVAYADLFNTLQVRGEYDQSFVFAKLIHEVADRIGVKVLANAQENSVMIEAQFVA